MLKEKAKLILDYGHPGISISTYRRDLKAFEKAVREDAAKVAESYYRPTNVPMGGMPECLQIAAAIRRKK